MAAKFSISITVQVAKQLVRLVLAVYFAVAELGLVEAHPVGAGSLGLGAIAVEVEAVDLVGVVSAVVLVVALPPAGNATLIGTPEVGGLALVDRRVFAFLRLVLTVLTIRIAIAPPVHGDATASWTFEVVISTGSCRAIV